MSSSSSSRATPKAELDGPILSIGKQCSHPSCNLVDFLPFKCQHCQDSFCQDHYKVAEHSCPKYDESKHNRIAPNCPLCNEPVAIKPGQDPNVRMEDHFARECSVMTGHTAKKSKPTCSQRKCGKVLFSPIHCDKCRKDYCPSHRFPADHSCNPAAITRSGVPTSSRLLALNSKASTSASNAASATLDAIKKTMSTNSDSSAASTSKSATPMPNPFSKVDRRAKAEQESRRKALRERAKKGLLSEEEKLRLASEEAQEAQEVGKKKDGECALM
ncbi:hypothetical protein BT96DRAFT_844570 [Gymnopus androsaceus JB14]|uniref:AN1-type domain-containing protein n=1 Tax=Gymnopus androsaceus JB14 TaxID=1447944 RepID=A0A6A4GCF1_9AGAR|nr:hypothetical protein BT96DRAFT_844570 [Gymnopus androsaceus JB14]